MVNPFGNYFYAFLYFLAGGLISNRMSNNKLNISSRLLLIIFLVALVLLFLYGILMTVSNHVLYDTVWDGYYSLMTLTLATSTFLFLSKISYKNEIINRVLVMVGSNTLGIFLVHQFAGALTIPYFRSLPQSSSLIFNLLYGFCVVLGSLLIVIVVKQLPLLKKLISV